MFYGQIHRHIHSRETFTSPRRNILVHQGRERCLSTPRALTSHRGGTKSAHGHGPATELAPPNSKGVLIQRMDMLETLN
ncbi:hypothetical protein J6590_059466 [Homalodisca vitripennis]|nr:hypothetical protein J6590_059466 [Homalodisca vitripennis]